MVIIFEVWLVEIALKLLQWKFFVLVTGVENKRTLAKVTANTELLG